MSLTSTSTFSYRSNACGALKTTTKMILMFTIFLLSMIPSVYSLHSDHKHRSHSQSSHYLTHQLQSHARVISSQCCKQKGGFECGNIIKECCVLPDGVTQKEAVQSPSQHCKSQGLFGATQNCPGQQITETCEYCHNVCQAKGGKLCGWHSSGQQQCCAEADCTGDISLQMNLQKCSQGSKRFDITGCIHDMDTTDSIVNGVAGFIGIGGEKKGDEKREDEKGNEKEKEKEDVKGDEGKGNEKEGKEEKQNAKVEDGKENQKEGKRENENEGQEETIVEKSQATVPLKKETIVEKSQATVPLKEENVKEDENKKVEESEVQNILEQSKFQTMPAQI